MGCLSTKEAGDKPQQRVPPLEKKKEEKPPKEPYDNEKENQKALDEVEANGGSMPFKFTYKQKWSSKDSTDDWIGPW